MRFVMFTLLLAVPSRFRRQCTVRSLSVFHYLDLVPERTPDVISPTDADGECARAKNRFSPGDQLGMSDAGTQASGEAVPELEAYKRAYKPINVIQENRMYFVVSYLFAPPLSCSNWQLITVPDTSVNTMGHFLADAESTRIFCKSCDQCAHIHRGIKKQLVLLTRCLPCQWCWHGLIYIVYIRNQAMFTYYHPRRQREQI